MEKCCIFSGGDFSGAAKIDAETFVICADSGLRHAQRLNIIPDIVLGDFDSYSGELPINAEIIRCKPEKDDTDTMMAVKLALKRGAKQITICGALGGRFDHTAANLQTLKYILDNDAKGIIEDENNVIMLEKEGRYKYPKRDGFYFSVFSFTESLHIKELSGVKYPLSDYDMTFGFPIGVSNEITEKEALIEFYDGIAMIVFSKM